MRKRGCEGGSSFTTPVCVGGCVVRWEGVYVCMYVCMGGCVCVYVCMYGRVCVYVCMYVWEGVW